MKLNANLMSLSIYKNYSKTLVRQSNALKRISSGEKIMSSKDNPHGLAKSELLRLQIRGLDVSSKNLQDSNAMLQTADSAMENINSSLTRMKELTIQAGGTMSLSDREIIQKEIDEIKNHIDTVANNAEFNGVKLLKAEGIKDNNNPKQLINTSGANVGDVIHIPLYNLSLEMLKTSKGDLSKGVDVTKEDNISNSLEIIEDISKMVTSIRSKYGAIMGKTERIAENLSEFNILNQGAESRIRDSDVAEEILTYSKEDILINASTALLAQSNRFPQDILRILENVK
ncbi:flagellin [Alloiococcus sp. CFN-8]|uniref:flagellin n=1 Tax=Alloiococcus sp. CFN-8 TaxID=3416081 RepID=UPI003CF81F9D